MREKLKVSAYELGLDFQDFSNWAEITLKLLARWISPKDSIHRFSRLLELRKEVEDLERQLAGIRMRVLRQPAPPVEQESVNRLLLLCCLLGKFVPPGGTGFCNSLLCLNIGDGCLFPVANFHDALEVLCWKPQFSVWYCALCLQATL
jgi:hypothetical protein